MIVFGKFYFNFKITYGLTFRNGVAAYLNLLRIPVFLMASVNLRVQLNCIAFLDFVSCQNCAFVTKSILFSGLFKEENPYARFENN